MSSPLLQYKISTSPSPLQTGVSGQITLHISPPAAAVLCQKINVTLTFGTGPGTIFVDKPSASNVNPANSDWQLNTPIVKGAVSTQTITLNNNNPGYVVKAPISFTLTGKVNASPTSGQLHITEDSTPNNAKPTFSPKSMSLSIPNTTAPSLSITSFVANNTASPLIPATDFTNTEAFTLSWNATNASSYQLFQSNIATPIYTGTKTNFSVKGVARDTTFILIATDNSSGKNDTVAQSLTITVSNPVLTSATITNLVAGNTAVTKAHVNKMTVDGMASFKGPLTAAGTATVTGLSTLNGGLTANGPTTIGGPATINSGLTVKGDLSTNQKSKILFTQTKGAQTTLNYRVNSDGFFIIELDAAALNIYQMSQFYINIQYPGEPAPLIFNLYCKGGQGYRSKTIPVCKGTAIACNVHCFGVPCSFSWIGGTAPTPIAASSLENTVLPSEVEAFQKQMEDLNAAATRKEAYARSFIEELQIQFGKELNQEAQDLLTTKLLNVERGE